MVALQTCPLRFKLHFERRSPVTQTCTIATAWSTLCTGACVRVLTTCADYLSATDSFLALCSSSFTLPLLIRILASELLAFPTNPGNLARSRLINASTELKARIEGDLGEAMSVMCTMATTTSEVVFEIVESYLKGKYRVVWDFIQRWPYVHWIACRRPKVFLGLWRSNPGGTLLGS